jgi:teichuronic acid biosynthesis glycosyltransferase TuaC
MKVLVLTNMYPSADKPSFGIFVAEQVEDLRRAGVDVDVLSFDGTQDRREYLRARGTLAKRVASGSHDLIHAHYGLSGALAITVHRTPVVTTFHGGDYTGLDRWHVIVSWVVARLTTPVVVSSEGRRRLRRPNAEVIPAGVDIERFVPIDRAEARRALGWDVTSPYALLLGSRALYNKRADLFDAAVARARERRPDLRAVSLEGFAREEVQLMLNAVDVAVMCSDTEGSPVAVREALACSTPVVGVDVGDVGEVLAGLPGCAIVPRSAAPVGDAIVTALDAGRPVQLRERARETSRPVIAERLVRLYGRVLGGRS